MQSLEQQSKILETKHNFLQQQKTTRSNMDSMIKSYINNLPQHLDTLAQEELKPQVEFGIMQELVQDLKNKCEDKINKHTEMKN